MIKICPFCKKNFESTKKKKYRKGYDIWETEYCSKSCAGKDVKKHHYVYKDGKKIRKYGARKIKSKIMSNGYLYLYTKDGWRSKHRLVMERYLGRKLIKGEIIHHRNGDKLDNRIKNLQLLCLAKHSFAVETKHSEDIHSLISIVKNLSSKGGK